MSALIEKIRIARAQYAILICALALLVAGWPLLILTPSSQASNPEIGQAIQVVPTNGKFTEDENGNTEFWIECGATKMEFQVDVTGPHNTVTASATGGATATITGNAGNYQLVVDPNGQTGQITITVYIDGHPCWTITVTIKKVTEWIVHQPVEATDENDQPITLPGTSFGNGTLMPIVRSEGGSYKLQGEFDIDDGGSGGGVNDFQLVLSGLPDDLPMSFPAGTTIGNFEFTLKSFTITKHDIRLNLVRAANGEVLCSTPISTGGGSGSDGYTTTITETIEYDETIIYEYPKTCNQCSYEEQPETSDYLDDTGTKCMAGYLEAGSTSDNPVDASFGMGANAAGAGGMKGDFQTNDLSSPSMASPASMTPSGTESPQIQTALNSNGQRYMKRVITATGTTEITNIIPNVGYTITFNKTAQASPTFANSTTAVRVIWGAVPGTTNSWTLRFIEKRFGGTIVETRYQQTKNADGSESWIIYQGHEWPDLATAVANVNFNAYLRTTAIEISKPEPTPMAIPYLGLNELVQPRLTETVQTATQSERSASTGQMEVIRRVQNTYRNHIWGNPLVKQVIDPDAGAHVGRKLTRHFTYRTIYSRLPGLVIKPFPANSHAPGDLRYARGLLHRFQDYDGSWYELDWDKDTGKLIKIRMPFKNTTSFTASPAGKEYSITRAGTEVRVSCTIDGTPIAETLIHGPYNDRSLTRLDQSGGSTGLTTTIARASVTPSTLFAGFKFTPDSNRITSITYPDGTKQTCVWTAPNSTLVHDCSKGNTDLTRGTRTLTTRDLVGNTIEVQNHALDFDNTAGNQKPLSTVTKSNFDDLCRPLTTTTSFFDGCPDQVSTILWGCCGLKQSTDIRGVVTTYHHDHLKRLETSESLGVVRATQYSGLTRRSIRIPVTVAPLDSHGHYTARGFANPPAGAIIQSESEYNLARELLASSSPSPQHTDGTSLVTTSYTYTYGLGITTTVDYPDGGQSTTQTFADGRTHTTTGTAVNDTSYDYGTSLPGVTFANGAVFGSKTTQANITQWTASTSNFLGQSVQTHFADGSNATRHYNSLGQITSSVDPDGVTSLFAYNDEGQRTHTAADLNGNNTLDLATDRVSFSESNYATAQDGTTRAMETISKLYGTSGGPLTTSVTQRSVDGLKSWNLPFNDTMRLSTSVTVLNGGGNWTTTSISASNLTSVSTHTAGLLDNTITRGGNSVETLSSVTYGYDDHLRTDSVTDARTGDTTVTFYNNDQSKDVTLVRAGTNSLTTAYTYDPMGRTLTTDSPDTTDANGNALVNIVNYSYDKRGNTLTTTGEQTYNRTYTYDALSRMSTLTTQYGTNSNNQTTTWNYDPQRGWLTSKDYPDNQGPSYTYTSGGRLKTRTWERGVITTYNYDFEGNNAGQGANAKAGDLAQIDYSDTTPDVTHRYTRWGSLHETGDITGTRRYTYRETIDLALLTEEGSVANVPTGGISIPRTATYGYDNLGRPNNHRLGTTVAPASDHHTAYGYDPQTGRLSTVTNALTNDTFTYGYLANSTLLHSLTSPVHTTINTYEQHRNVLKTKSHSDLAATPALISATTYGSTSAGTDAVNAIGQRLSTTYTGSAYTSQSRDGHHDYAYNANGELAQATRKDNTGAPLTGQDLAFNYDGIGNRLTATIDGVVNSTYTPNENNQYDEILENSVNAVRVHDPDGNLTDDGTQLYSWDAENRLIQVNRKSDNALISEYRYDAMSRRVWKKTTATAPQGATEAAYHYQGWNLCAEYTATNKTLTTLKRNYTWGTDLSGSMQGAGGVGGLLSIEEKTGANQGTHYPLYDGNGNLTQTLDGNTALTSHYEYDAFGQSIFSSGAYKDENPYKFSTKYLDEETDFYYYGYRYYDPKTGRWPSRDPIEERGGFNLYGFVRNNGVNKIDKFGLLEMGDPTGDTPHGSLAIDFLFHYYFGNGTFKPELSAIKKTFGSEIESIKEKVHDLALTAILRLLTSKCWENSYNEFHTENISDRGLKKPIDATWRDELGFVLGNTTLLYGYNVNVSLDCCTCEFEYSGEVRYTINDEFADPLDIGEFQRRVADPIDWFLGGLPSPYYDGDFALGWQDAEDVEVGGTPFNIRKDWQVPISKKGKIPEPECSFKYK